MIVVDASAALLAVVDDGDARDRLSNDPLAAPHLIDSEVVQALRTHVRRSEIRTPDAEAALGRWSQLGIQRVGVVGMLDRIWQLRDNLTAYDATYVAVAETLECELLTADARLARAPGPICQISLVRT